MNTDSNYSFIAGRVHYVLVTKRTTPSGREFRRDRDFDTEIDAQVAATRYAAQRGIRFGRQNNWGEAHGRVGLDYYSMSLRRYEKMEDGSILCSPVELRTIIEVKPSDIVAI